MISRVIISICCFYFLGCSADQPEKEAKNEIDNNTPTASQYQVIVTENNLGYGYQILKDGKLTIDQPTIPAIQGNQSFSSKEKAQKTAEYLIEKLNKGVFPPTISVEELDSLKVL